MTTIFTVKNAVDSFENLSGRGKGGLDSCLEDMRLISTPTSAHRPRTDLDLLSCLFSNEVFISTVAPPVKIDDIHKYMKRL